MTNVYETQNTLKENVLVKLIETKTYGKIMFSSPAKYKMFHFYQVIVEHEGKQVFKTRSTEDLQEAKILINEVANNFELDSISTISEVKFLPHTSSKTPFI